MHKYSKNLIIVSTLILLLEPAQAHAYVDPGIIGMLFQALFTFIFGVLFVWIIKPIHYIKALWKRVTSRSSAPKTEDKGDS